jgi:hypothetical protein
LVHVERQSDTLDLGWYQQIDHTMI